MRNVIVTGGSRGIGLGIALTLLGAGYRVIAVARKQNSTLTAAMQRAEVTAAGSLQFVPFDLADINAIPNFLKGLQKSFGSIYGLVNNAGISVGSSLSFTSISNIEELVRVNTLSPIVLTKSAIGQMMAEGEGRVINIASVVAFTGYSGLSVYSATKASLIGFTRSLAREVGHMGINVNAVAPGFINTDMTRGLQEDQRQKIARRSALNHLAEVDDVANAVEFLLGEKSKNITGTVLTVDAGNTA